MTIALTLLSVATAILFVALVLASWASTLFGLPGNWINAAMATFFGYLIPDSWQTNIGWKWIVALFVLAAIGELLEFGASAVGTSRAGGSRRAAIFALIGSMLGAVGGAMVTIPVPVVGTLIGVVVFGGVGAAVGAFVAETSRGTDSEKTMQISWGAFWGRLLGTGAKTGVGCVMVAMIVVALAI